MKLWQAITFLCLIWAMIYLTLLGAQELRGEEARRILPAQEMLASGDWIVPRIAGEVYSNKPPLINWLIAASFSLTGTHNEFTARLPSALSVLALALGALLCLRRLLGNDKALAVALMLLTAIAMIDKGRMAEIESVYIALFGLACFTWIRLWATESSPWLIWTIPYIFLGIAWLAKGPVHLVFWIPFLICVLRSGRRLRDLIHPAHWIGIGLMVLLFLPWMRANIAAIDAPQESVGTWIEQLKMRVDFSEVDFKKWAMRPLEILANFLPWTAPLAFALFRTRKKNSDHSATDRFAAVITGSLAAAAIGSLIICLMPGGAPRYMMPVYPLAAIAVVGVYSRLSETDSTAYEKYSRLLILIVTPLLIVAALGIAFAAMREQLPVSLGALCGGCLALGAAFLYLFRNRNRWNLFSISSLVLAAGAMALVAATTPLQEKHRAARSAAHSLLTKAADSGRTLVVYADPTFRNGYTKELRLLFYLHPHFTTASESQSLPKGDLLVLGRPGWEKSYHETDATFEVLSGEELRIFDRPLSLLRVQVPE